jgi:hypothetical protein
LFAENSFSQLSPIHELGEIQRQTLNLAALRHGNAEERKDSGRSSRDSGRSRRWSAWTWDSASHLRLVLATRWAAGTTLDRSGRWWSCGGRSCVVLVLASTRAAPTSRRHQRAKVQTRTICVSHVEKGEG